MPKQLSHPFFQILCLILATFLLLAAVQPANTLAAADLPKPPSGPAPAVNMPVFRKPVVPGATISGYFDHNPSSGWVTFYNGQHNNDPAYGFYFSCNNPYMYDFVGCVDNVGGINACAPSRQLWYDNHHGTDYEYSSAWYTGAACDPGRFAGITHPVYAPARGKVTFAGYNADRPANGYHIVMKHDLNNDGNFENDNLRAYYLHFTANQLAVGAGQVVNEGQYIGLGGSTGYSSSPHLHFEVQRSADNFSSTAWPVDPYGWDGSGTDPWSYANVNFWKVPVVMKYHYYLPGLIRGKSVGCETCGEMLRNRGFESGHSDWAESGVQVIASTSDVNLHVQPSAGNWLAWLAGRNNSDDILYQDFIVPEGANKARLIYDLYINTQEVEASIYDHLSVDLQDPSSGKVIQNLDYVGNTFTPTNQWVQRGVDIPDLSAWQGKTLRLKFEAVGDSNLITNFYVDEVSLKTAP